MSLAPSLRPLRLAAFAAVAFLTCQAADAGLLGDLIKANEKPIVLDASSDARQVLAQTLRSDDPTLAPAGAKPRRVGVSAFQLQFITDAYESSTKKQFGIGDRPESKTSVAYRLESPSAEVFQAITDRAKEHLEQLLAQRGYEVIPAEKLAEDVGFAKKVQEAQSARKVEQGFFTKNGSINVSARGTADTWGVFGSKGEYDMARALGPDVALLRVKMVVNFASLEEMGVLDRIQNNAASGVKSQVGLSIFSNREGDSPSRVELVNATGVFGKPLLRTVYFPNPIDKGVRKEEVGAAEVATGVLMSLMGGSAKSAAYVVTPADDYQDQMNSAMDQLDRVLVETLPPAAR